MFSLFFFFKQKTAYEMRISDWSSDVCSSDLEGFGPGGVSLIIETLTDNRNSTATNVRTIVSKNGGNLGASGSVSHGFDRMGLITYRSEERRVGKACGSKGRSRWSPLH